MKNKITTLIDSILSESSLDSRIESGIFDIHNFEHMEIMAEHMAAHGIDEKIISEVINELVVGEGKFPERQAYNKDGWLVTFPSAEYKQAAIKKGTHYASDPTHGKGGMHLYYKKRGKQQRQTQQDTTKVPVEKPQQNAPVNPPEQNIPSDKSKPAPSDKQPVAPIKKSKAAAPVEKEPEEYDDEYTADDDAADEERAEKAFGNFWAKNAQQSPKPADASQEAPAANVPPPTPVAPAAPVAPDYTKPSKKFAETKGWKVTPYGEWRDKSGNTVAVTGLSGEVVPLKNTDREEFKLFSEKNPM